MRKLTRREVLKYIGAGAAITAVPMTAGCLGGDTIPIGSLLPLSGNLKDFGPPMMNGVELAVKRVNENNGGIQLNQEGETVKKEVKVIQEDSKTSSDPANSALQKLINVDGVPAFVGAAGSGVSKSILETAKNNKVVQVSPSNTSPYFTTVEDDGYYWRTCASDELQAAAMAKYARDQGYQTASTLYINNAYGQGFSSQFEKWFADKSDGEMVKKIGYSGDASSYSSEISEIAQGNPDLVVLVGYPEEGSIVLSEAYQNGILDEANWLLSEGLRSDDLAEKVGTTEGGGSVAEGIKGTTPDPRAAKDAYNAFSQHYNEEYGSAPSTFVPHSYDAMSLIMLAMERAGEATGEAIKNNLMEVANPPGTETYDPVEGINLIREGKEINFYGSGGMKNFNDVGDVTSTFAIWQIEDGDVKLGQQIPLPQELRPD